MKRTPMPRWPKPLERRTELRSTKGLDRGKPLRPKPKPKAQQEAEAEVRRVVFERDGGCLMAQLEPDRCFGRRRTFHHLRKDGQGGAYTAENGVCLCSFHNDDVEDDPPKYRRLGLVVTRAIDHAEAARRRIAAGLGPRKDC